MNDSILSTRIKLVEKVINGYGAILANEKCDKKIWLFNQGYYCLDTAENDNESYIIIKYGKGLDEDFEEICKLPASGSMSTYYEMIHAALGVDYPQTLTIEEIEKIFDFNSKRNHHQQNFVEIADELSLIGFWEFKEAVYSIGKPDIKLNEKVKERSKCIFHCLGISGTVDSNPAGLACPRCGAKYVAWLQFYCIMYKSPKDEIKGTTKREPQRLMGASNVFNKSYHNCLACDFSFDEE